MRLSIRAGVLLMLLLALLAPSFAQQETQIWQFPLAAVTDDGVVLHGASYASPREVTRRGTYENHRDLVWSPDGHTLAFRAYYMGRDDVLLITDNEGAPPFPLIPDLKDSNLPFSFAPDGRLLYAYQTEEIQQTEDGLYGPVFELRAIEPVPGAESERVGTFIYAPGCGGGSHLPADWRYWDEAGFEGNETILALTPYGIVHNGNCMGRRVALANPDTGEDVVLDGQVHRAKVSPDGTQVIGLRGSDIVLIDLATRTVTVVPHDPDHYPDQVAWGAPGTDTIFYSVREPGEEKLVRSEDNAQALAEAVGVGVEWMYLDFWISSIHQIDLNTQTDTELHTTAGYAVGRMIATPDGAGLLFSVVPNMGEWVAAVLDGTLEPASWAYSPEVLATVRTQLYYLHFATGEVTLLGEDVNMTVLNSALYLEMHDE